MLKTQLKKLLKRLYLNTIGKIIPTDIFSRRMPVSIKGVIFHENKVVLLLNERGEWDLPGGKLDRYEDVLTCLKREIKEELSVAVEIEEYIYSFTYQVAGWVNVFIISFKCRLLEPISQIQISSEHLEVGFFTINELSTINISEDYKNVILKSIHLVDNV